MKIVKFLEIGSQTINISLRLLGILAWSENHDFYEEFQQFYGKSKILVKIVNFEKNNAIMKIVNAKPSLGLLENCGTWRKLRRGVKFSQKMLILVKIT